MVIIVELELVGWECWWWVEGIVRGIWGIFWGVWVRGLMVVFGVGLGRLFICSELICCCGV